MSAPVRTVPAWLLPGLWFLLALLAIGAGRFSPSTHGLNDVGGTIYVVRHNSYQLTLTAGFVIFGIAYLLVGQLLRRPYNPWLGFTHLGLTILGVGLIFAPGFLIMNGALNRFPDAVGAFALLNSVSTVGYLVTLTAFAAFMFAMIDAVPRRPGPSANSE